MKYKHSDNTAWRIVDGRAFVINVKDSTLHELDETATFLWKNLEKPADADSLAEKLSQDYEVSPAEARGDVSDFFVSLKSKGLISEAVKK